MSTPITEYLTSCKGFVLLLAPPGHGKTTLLTQLPSPNIILCDKGNLKGPLEYIKRKGLKLDATFDDPYLDKDGKPVERGWRALRVATLANESMKNPSIKTIGIDSITTLSEMVLDEVRRTQGWSMANGTTTLVDKSFEKQGWGQYAGIWKEMLMKLKASDKLVVFCAHIDTREDEDDDSKSARLLRYIAIPGMMRSQLAGYFDDVWMIESEEKIVGSPARLESVRYLRTSPTSVKDAALGLKSSVGFERRFEMDFDKINQALAK